MNARSEMTQPPLIEKPLLGFGWMGWTLLAIAGILLLCAAGIGDADQGALRITQSIFGVDAANWIEQWFFKSHRHNAIPPGGPSPELGILGLLAVLLCLWVSPCNVANRWTYAIAILAVTTPVCISYAWRWEYLFEFPTYGAWASGHTYITGLSTLLFAAMLYGITRSKWLFIGVVTLGALSIVSYAVFFPRYLMAAINSMQGDRFWLTLTGWLWNPLLLAILLGWAIPARIRYNRWWLCCKCRYDMRDLGTTTCPECGTVNERMPAPEAGAAAADS